MALDYEDDDACAAWLAAQLGFDTGDFEEMLTLSAGTAPDGATIYRPYFVGCLALSANRNARVRSLKGVELDPAATIQGWLTKQAVIDRLKSLSVPAGAEATLANVTNTPSPSAPGPILAGWSGS